MKILVTLGDANGIGLEALIKAISEGKSKLKNYDITLAGNANIVKQYAKLCNLPVNILQDKLEINGFTIKLIEACENYKLSLGTISVGAAKSALQSINIGTKLVLDNNYDALVTLPVSKEAISLVKNGFTGHTSYIAGICKEKSPLMILFTENIRVALVTTHIPLYLVPRRVTKHRLLKIIRLLNNSLKKDFGVINPKIAMLSINPHGGEGGTIGKEEQQVLLPAMEIMKKKGVCISGAFAADGFFAHGEYMHYDSILSMYHDQGLTALKILSAGNGGVNFTANLPIVRTSPDHGTAFNISGTNSADYKSTLMAILTAGDIYKNRQNYKKLNIKY